MTNPNEISDDITSSLSNRSDSKTQKKLLKTKQFDYTFKIVIIGDSGVGKSCILLRFTDDKFNENFITTIGVDFRFKSIIIDNKCIKLQMWDTAGQERFKTITSAYYRGADGVIIVYDITDKNSFSHIKDWIDEVGKYTDNDPIKIIIGNKCDLNKERQVNENDIKIMSEQTGLNIIETSAKNSVKINEVMETLTKMLIDNKIKGNLGKGNFDKGVKINNNEKKENKGCC